MKTETYERVGKRLYTATMAKEIREPSSRNRKRADGIRRLKAKVIATQHPDASVIDQLIDDNASLRARVEALEAGR